MVNALLAYGGVTPSAAARVLNVADIDPRRRPETLSIEELVRVADLLDPSQSQEVG